MDSVVVSRATAIMIGQLGGLGVLDLEGLWTRYDDPEPVLAEIRDLTPEQATARMQAALRRADQARARHATGSPRSARRASPSPARSRPQRTQELYETVVAAGVDLFVIRGTTVSRRARLEERRSRSTSRSSSTSSTCPSSSAARRPTPPPCTSCAPARRACSSASAAARRRRRARRLGIHAPMATAVADVAGARRDYLDESGGRYVHVIADGGVGTSGDIVKAIAMRRGRRHARRRRSPARRTRPAAATTGAPRRTTPKLPRGQPRARSTRSPRSRRCCTARRPAPTAPANLIGALRTLDGDDRILRPQGVPARRGRRRAVPGRLSRRTAVANPLRARGIRRTPRVALKSITRRSRATAGTGSDDGDTAADDAEVGDAFDEARTRGARGRDRPPQAEGTRHPRHRRRHRRHRSRARRGHPRPLASACSRRATGRRARRAARRSSCTAASATSSSSTSGWCARRSSSAACCCSASRRTS